MTCTRASDEAFVPPPAFAVAPLAIALALALALRMPADVEGRTLRHSAMRTVTGDSAPLPQTAVDVAGRHRQDGATSVRSRMTPKETVR